MRLSSSPCLTRSPSSCCGGSRASSSPFGDLLLVNQLHLFSSTIAVHRTLDPASRFFCGSAAGAVSVSLTYPLDLMRARLAVQTKANSIDSGLTSACATTLRKEGVRALFHGLSPTLLGIIPYAGTSFFTYSTLKICVEDFHDSHGLPHGITTPERVVSGGFAGLVAQSMTYPLDIMRRRMQTDGVLSAKTHRGFVDTARFVWTTEGLRGFYKGVTMNWIKGPVAVSISFTVYDLLHSKWLV
eukprot:m.311917 g.311917  ORF g.311917 m.311917 type:complete len:242 (+) comp55377_c0_seq6:498-1223(+)